MLMSLRYHIPHDERERLYCADLATQFADWSADAHQESVASLHRGLRKMAAGYQNDAARFSARARGYLFELLGVAPEDSLSPEWT